MEIEIHTCNSCAHEFNIVERIPHRDRHSSYCDCGRRFYLSPTGPARILTVDLEKWRVFKNFDFKTLKWFGKCKDCNCALAGREKYDYCSVCKEKRLHV
jgi:hypothetical protein